MTHPELITVTLVNGPLDGAEVESLPADTADAYPERIVLEAHDGWYERRTDAGQTYVWVSVLS